MGPGQRVFAPEGMAQPRTLGDVLTKRQPCPGQTCGHYPCPSVTFSVSRNCLSCPPPSWCFSPSSQRCLDLWLCSQPVAVPHIVVEQPRPPGSPPVRSRALSWSQRAHLSEGWQEWPLPRGPGRDPRWPRIPTAGLGQAVGGQIGLAHQVSYLGCAGSEGGLLPHSSGAQLRGWHLSLPAT